MKNVSNTFIHNARQHNREIDVIISVTKNNETTIYNLSEIESIESEYTGNYGVSFMQTMKGTLLGRHDLKQAVINVKVGLTLGDSPFEYVDYGDFSITETEVDIGSSTEGDKTTFFASDLIVKTMVPFNPKLFKINFPITLQEYAEAILQFLKLEYTDFNLLNGANLLDRDPYNMVSGEVNYRYILEDIAATSNTTVKVTENKIDFIALNAVDIALPVEYNLNNSQLFSISIGESFPPVNMLNLARQDESDDYILPADWELIPEDTRSTILLHGNSIIDRDRFNYGANLYNTYKDLEYQPFNAETYGTLFLEPLDIIEVEDLEGNLFKTVLTTTSFTITSGMAESIESIKPYYLEYANMTVDNNNRQSLDRLTDELQQQIDSGKMSTVVEYNKLDIITNNSESLLIRIIFNTGSLGNGTIGSTINISSEEVQEISLTLYLNGTKVGIPYYKTLSGNRDVLNLNIALLNIPAGSNDLELYIKSDGETTIKNKEATLYITTSDVQSGISDRAPYINVRDVVKINTINILDSVTLELIEYEEEIV